MLGVVHSLFQISGRIALGDKSVSIILWPSFYSVISLSRLGLILYRLNELNGATGAT